MAAALFEAGADPEACDGYGQKPLDYAVSADNAAFIEAALDAGADPAGSGDARDAARRKARVSSPDSGAARAWGRLLRAGSGLRTVED